MSATTCCQPGAYYDGSQKPDGSIIHLKTPKGTVEAYSVGTGGKYLIIAPDVFGHEFLTTQKYADSLSSLSGVRVLVVNNLKSGPWPADNDFSHFPQWVAANPHQFGIDQLNDLVTALHQDKETYHTEGILLLGICYGAKAEVSILSNPEYKLVRGAIWNHPSFLTAEEAQTIQTDKSFLFNAPPDDFIFVPELREAWQKTLAEKKIPAVFRIVEGVKHGFTTRPGNEKEKEEASKARDATVEWIKKTLA